MKDAILNGTGDSRYLKSKITTGTTWEQALAMLNAGTFPVDLNGINSEGFQQLGTPLNKANILKDAVSTKLGLVGDKTPNDMFGVLADCGNLHVWRKTVVTTEEVPAVPAGYTLGDVETNVVLSGIDGSNSECSMRVLSGDSITVNYDGSVVLTGNTRDNTYGLNLNGIKYPDNMVGRFVTITYYISHPPSMYIIDGTWFIPSDATVTHHYGDGTTYGYEYVVSKAKKVNATAYIPAIPAGTSATYPVSINRNAYQEGNNAKPAGYVLGDVVSGTFLVANRADASKVTWGPKLTVSDDGTIEIDSDGKSSGYPSYTSFPTSSIPGNFMNLNETPEGAKNNIDEPFKSSTFFIPSDATVTRDGDGIKTNKYQPVTGYPAIGGTIVDYVEKRTEATDGRIMASDYQSSSYSCVFEVASSIEFDDSGNISLVSPTNVSVYLNTSQNPPLVNWWSLTGKYIKLKSTPSNTDTYFPGSSNIGYIDSTATISATTASGVTTATITSGAYLIFSTAVVYGETIEYLGCLGNKSMIQTLRYVGTGTYGESNPTTLTFIFEPKLIFVYGSGLNSDYETIHMLNGQTYATSRHSSTTGFIFTVSWSGNMVSWYNTSSNAELQANKLGEEYRVIGIG